MSEPQPFTDDELTQARNAPLGWTARRWLATVDALRAALAVRPDPVVCRCYPNPYDHYEDCPARLASAGSVTPTEREWVDDVLAMFDEGTAAKRAGSATPTPEEGD